jgi:hypothetical protein
MKRVQSINKERVLQSIILEANLALRNLNKLTDENAENLLHCESMLKQTTRNFSWKQGESLNKIK